VQRGLLSLNQLQQNQGSLISSKVVSTNQNARPRIIKLQINEKELMSETTKKSGQLRSLSNNPRKVNEFAVINDISKGNREKEINLKIVEIGSHKADHKIAGGLLSQRAHSTRVVDQTYDSQSERSMIKHDRKALLFPSHHHQHDLSITSRKSVSSTKTDS
jgi:hypothetical protein